VPAKLIVSLYLKYGGAYKKNMAGKEKKLRFNALIPYCLRIFIKNKQKIWGMALQHKY
jgi:hypothetical protein